MVEKILTSSWTDMTSRPVGNAARCFRLIISFDAEGANLDKKLMNLANSRVRESDIC